ncbi:MAG TPA: hypothetical protein VNS50_08685 [Ginsengibacter sp.]|nr:hypothetical protein [Ginsengibacter sp.]
MKKLPEIISYPALIYTAITVLLFTWAYSEFFKQRNQQAEKSPKTKPAIIKKPASSFNDTIIVDKKSAVFYSPDSLQMEKIKAVNQKAIFDMITHDCYYQMQNARIELRKYWPRVHIVEATKDRYILFVKENKTKTCIDLNNKNDICGLFLFDTKKDPVLVDMPNIDTELGFYFSK